MEVLPGPLPDGRRSGGDEGLGSRLNQAVFLLVRPGGSGIKKKFHYPLVRHIEGITNRGEWKRTETDDEKDPESWFLATKWLALDCLSRHLSLNLKWLTISPMAKKGITGRIEGQNFKLLSFNRTELRSTCVCVCVGRISGLNHGSLYERLLGSWRCMTQQPARLACVCAELGDSGQRKRFVLTFINFESRVATVRTALGAIFVLQQCLGQWGVATTFFCLTTYPPIGKAQCPTEQLQQ